MRLVLDDNIVRSLGHGEVNVGPFVSLRDEGVSIHIADGAMAELLSQISERRFRWQNWLVARRALAEILDAAEPVLLGGRQGLYRAGIRGATDPVADIEIAMALNHSTEWWRAFMRADELGDIFQAIRVGDHLLALPPGAAGREVATFKSSWRRGFELRRIGDELVNEVQRVLPRRGDGVEQLDSIVGVIARNLDKKNRGQPGPPASVRLDAMIRVYVLLQLRSMRARDPYSAERNENDSFDHDLLRYLAYPAALCTLDGGVGRKMQTAKCWQAPWVVRPNDLASPFGRRRIRKLAWPTA